MAGNLWNQNPIILDTAANDVAYDSAEDVINGGDEYSTMRYKIKGIMVSGANTNNLVLNQCLKTDFTGSAFTGTKIIDRTVVTGALEQYMDFGEGIWFSGLYPSVIAGTGKIWIYLA